MEHVKPVLWSTNIVRYLYSFRALFVLYEAELDNKYALFDSLKHNTRGYLRVA